MSFSAELLAPVWYWLGGLGYAVLLGLALLRAPWHYLKNSSDTNVLLGSCILMWVMWQFRAGVGAHPGLEFHLLFVTAVTLMFGWAFALLAVSGSQLLLSLQGVAAWSGFTLEILANGATAIGTTVLVYRLAYRYLPRHFFVYVFVCSFFGAAMAMLASRLAGMLLLLAGGAYSLRDLAAGDYFVLLPLMMFPEAFINGMAMTLLVAYRPHWVSSFRDGDYLRGK